MNIAFTRLQFKQVLEDSEAFRNMIYDQMNVSTAAALECEIYDERDRLLARHGNEKIRAIKDLREWSRNRQDIMLHFPKLSPNASADVVMGLLAAKTLIMMGKDRPPLANLNIS